MVPAIWLWLSNTAFWFYYLKPTALQTLDMLEKIGLVRFDVPDHAFLALALTIMILCLVYVLGVFLWWRQPLPASTSPSIEDRSRSLI
jgi:hypothetical protein